MVFINPWPAIMAARDDVDDDYFYSRHWDSDDYDETEEADAIEAFIIGAGIALFGTFAVIMLISMFH